MQVGGPGTCTPTQINPTTWTGGPGYVIIYINNQSIGNDVWFDDLNVSMYSGGEIEENFYYPFGLTISEESGNSGALPAQPYKYNSKELEKHFGLEQYDYGARVYDPQLGIWHQIDPLAEISRRWSPYNYALNNPVRFIDPDGMVWKDPNAAEELKTRLKNKQSEIEQERDDLNAQLNDSENPLNEKKSKKAQREVEDLQGRIEKLTQAIEAIDLLGADENNVYDFQSGKGDEVGYVKKGDDGIVYIVSPSIAKNAHEIDHIATYLRKKTDLNFSKNNRLTALDRIRGGLGDEISAYKAEYSYEPRSLQNSPASINHINGEYISSLKDAGGTPYYPAIVQYMQWLEKQMKKQKPNEK